MGIFDLFSGSPRQRLDKELNRRYKRSVTSALKNCDNELLDGMMVYHAIITTYDSLKHNMVLMDLYGFSQLEYLKAVEESLYREGPKYISNFNAMGGRKETQDKDDVFPPSFYDIYINLQSL